MKIDVTRNLIGFDGELVEVREGEDGLKPMTVRYTLTTALMTGNPEDNPDGVEKLRRFELARRIHRAGTTLVLSSEETVLLKKLVGDMFVPNVVGPVWILLEGEDEEELNIEAV